MPGAGACAPRSSTESRKAASASSRARSRPRPTDERGQDLFEVVRRAQRKDRLSLEIPRRLLGGRLQGHLHAALDRIRGPGGRLVHSRVHRCDRIGAWGSATGTTATPAARKG